MTRVEAYDLMCQMIQNQNLRRHGLAVEAIMRELCEYLKEKHKLDSRFRGNDNVFGEEFDEEEWAIVGMLHDADYELIEKDPTRHTLVTAEKLKEIGGVSERIIEGIKAHHWGIKDHRDNIMESAVFAADDTSGLITAAALVQPDKKLSSVTVESLMKKFKQKSFAAGAKREQIEIGINELNISLEEMMTISLKAMQGIADKIGL